MSAKSPLLCLGCLCAHPRLPLFSPPLPSYRKATVLLRLLLISMKDDDNAYDNGDDSYSYCYT